jgi:PBP1b-binding outer membrane lipoprotein LpoB
MKHIKYLALFLFGALIFTSCIDNTAPEDEFTVGVNTVAFENRISSYSGIADGSSYSIELPMKLKGPSATDVTGDLTVNIAVSDASTAIEGTHFSLPQSSITLVDGQDHLGIYLLLC